MRFVPARGLAALAAAALATGAAGVGAAATGGPTCAMDGTFAGDVGSFLRVTTCRPAFVSADRYRPARFRLVSGALPPGLSLWGDGASAAQVDGTPRKAGVYRFTIAATDALGRRAQGTYTVQIHPELVLPGGKLGSAVAGAPYWARVSASGGKPPYTYGAFSLNGVTLDRSTGVISGTVDAGRGTPALACPFRLSVTDATGATVSAVFGVAVSDASGRRARASCSVFDGPGFTWVRSISPRRGPLPVPGASRALVRIAPVTISGVGFRSVTRVTFTGAPAVFRIDSDRRITAIPPVGAHTGPIKLTTADGRIRNAGIYRVFFGA